MHNSVYIHPSAEINWDNVEIAGEDIYIGPGCVIGFPAEDKKHLISENEDKCVVIRSGARLTGLVTVDAGTIQDTIIGEGSFLMKHSHVGHDSIIDRDVTLSCGVKIGGHCVVMKGANLGLNAVVHPRQVIGAYSMIGMGSVVPSKKRIWPFGKYAGNPVKHMGENSRLILKMLDEGKDVEKLRNKADIAYSNLMGI